MKTVSGPRGGFNPKSGAKVPGPKRYVLSTSRPSNDAQKFVRQPDLPKQDSQLRVPAPTHPAFRSPASLSAFSKSTIDKWSAASIHKKHSVNMGAVGYSPNATKSSNPIISGYRTQGAQRVAGRPGTNAKSASAKEVARVRQTYPGLGIGKWRP